MFIKCFFSCTNENVFKQSFSEINNKYNTKSSNVSFYKPLFKTKCAQYAISYQGPHLWNTLIPKTLQNASQRFKN